MAKPKSPASGKISEPLLKSDGLLKKMLETLKIPIKQIKKTSKDFDQRSTVPNGMAATKIVISNKLKAVFSKWSFITMG